ncbi:uncharacterized protein LOC121080610 [Falco naumanni]|uniref:uncharacterized protein LOC121080610 n=1 Tax=Falco naumanni TaxID=148594 RepID=UPI001ADEA75C|nr:uncharacterized protein LOC121080610 [Falco naumanni]
MVKVFSPPVHIPAGSTIAQLIPFQATVPQKGEKDRGQGAFGSTGMPNIAFCQLIGAERPKCNVKISGPQGVNLPNVSMMIDTGADVTVLPFSVWPTMWELDSAGSTISGIGGSRLTQVSNLSVFRKEGERSPHVIVAKACYVLNWLNPRTECTEQPIFYHFSNNPNDFSNRDIAVQVFDPVSNCWSGPHNLLTWGRGYACISTGAVTKWIPAK